MLFFSFHLSSASSGVRLFLRFFVNKMHTHSIRLCRIASFFPAEVLRCCREVEDLRAQKEIVTFERAAITKCKDLNREIVV